MWEPSGLASLSVSALQFHLRLADNSTLRWLEFPFPLLEKLLLGTTFIEQLHISRLKLNHSWKTSLISPSKHLISRDLKPHARKLQPNNFAAIPALSYKNVNTLIAYILSLSLAEESMEKTRDVMKVSKFHFVFWFSFFFFFLFGYSNPADLSSH